MKKRVWVAFAVILSLLMSGCTGGEAPESTDSSSTTTTSTTTATTTTTTAAPVLDLNPLTGIKELAPGSSTRAVGIMLGNNPPSRPQFGIQNADWFFETETEGAITRIMAIFANLDRVPDKVAPVRSARTPFVLMAETLDLIYVHAGGSTAADAALKARDMADINALGYDGTYFWRDPTLRSEKGYEYSLMTSGINLKKLADKRNYRTESRSSSPFRFDGNAAIGNAATEIECKASRSQYVTFKYSAESGLYAKSNGKLSDPTPHKSAAGEQIRVSNVIVMFDRRYAENNTTSSFDLEDGVGMLYTAGREREIRWSRTASALKFTEKDGSELSVSAGKTYFLLVNENYRSGTFSKA